MVVVARSDLIYALTTYLRSFSELTALVNSAGGWKGSGSGPRISGEIKGGPNGWKMPTTAVIYRKAGGPPDEYLLGRKRTRIDTFCYGATGLEAGNVWAMLDAILVPAQGGVGGRVAQVTLNGCRVDTIEPEADAVAVVEADTLRHWVFAPYAVTWWSV